MQSGRGSGPSYRTSTREIIPNSAYGDQDLAAGQGVTHDFNDPNFDANEASHRFLVGGGNNWFTRIFNPPNQNAIQANNAYEAAKAGGQLSNQQAIDLAKAKVEQENSQYAEDVMPFVTDPAMLGTNAGPLNNAAMGGRLRAGFGPIIAKEGAYVGIPQAQFDRANQELLNKIGQSPGFQKAFELGKLKQLVPDVHFGNNVLSYGMNPLAGGTMLEGGGEEITSKEMMPHFLDPKTGKMVPSGLSQIVQNKIYRPPSAMPFNKFQGGEDSYFIPQPKAAPQPAPGTNQLHVSPYNQPTPPDPFLRDEDSPYIGEDTFPSLQSPFLFEQLRRKKLMNPQF